MVYFTLMVLVAAVAGVVWFLSKVFNNNSLKPIAIIGGIIFMILISFGFGFHQIESGYIGIVYSFGSIVGQIGEGANFVLPWADVKRETIQITSHKFTKLTCFSSETQDVFVNATLNIRVSPVTVQTLYRTVGPNWFNVIVAPRVAQNFKDEIVKYTSVGVAPNRETIRHDVTRRLEKECGPQSIEIVDLLLDDVDFNPAFKNAIEQKQIATQNALEEQQKVIGERHKADQKIEASRGEGESILVVARSQAKANQELSASLTPALVQYAMIQKISDKIQVMMLPAGQNFILDPSSMINKK